MTGIQEEENAYLVHPTPCRVHAVSMSCLLPPAQPKTLHSTSHHAARCQFRVGMQNIVDDQTLIPTALPLPLISRAMCNDVQVALSSMPHATRVGIRQDCRHDAQPKPTEHAYPFLSLGFNLIPIRQWITSALAWALPGPCLRRCLTVQEKMAVDHPSTYSSQLQGRACTAISGCSFRVASARPEQTATRWAVTSPC